MTGPGDEMAAGSAGRGHLRASDADREQVIEVLKAGFVQGRLAKDELDVRVGQALASLTYADLTAITADLPAGLTAARPAPKLARARRRPPVNSEIRTGVRVSVAATMLTALLWAVAILTGSVPVFLAAWGGVGTVFVVWFITGTRVLGCWLDKRSGRPPPPRTALGAGNQASQRGASGVAAGQRRAPRGRPAWPSANAARAPRFLPQAAAGWTGMALPGSFPG